MCPKEANIFLAEDNEENLDLKRRLLVRGNHTIVLEAHTQQEALAAIDHFEEHNVHVAVLDANLTQGEYKGDDGVVLAATIREKAPQVKIVGMSSNPFPTEASIDIDASRSDKYFKVAQIIDQL